MSDVGRYRKLYPRIWRHPSFIAVPKTARELVLYLLTGPQTSPIGLFHFSIATAAEDLGVGVETLRERLRDVCLAFGWHFDAAARVFYIPSWWRWNTPENANVLKGNLKALSEIPPSGLVEAFSRNLETLPETLHQTFMEGCRIRMPKPSRIQDQEQEAGSGKQEQERALSRGGASRRVASEPSQSEKKEGIERHVKVAREVLNLTNPDGPIEDLIDAFLCISSGVPRVQVTAALNQALSERRQRVLQ